MQKIISAIVLLSLVGCNAPPRRDTYDAISAEMRKATEEAQARPAQPDAVANALLPPLRIEAPNNRQPVEPRFNLAFNNLPAQQFFMVLVSGTRYSMLVPPEVTGSISANLKDVTVFEALDAIRELYGYDYKVEGTRIYIKPLTMQTKVFQVNYLTGTRSGQSDIRVTSGSVSDTPTGNAATAAAATGTAQTGQTGGVAKASNSSNITTRSNSDFWSELRSSLEAIVGGAKDGRSIVISPQSGVVVVRAMWSELRDVAAYLKATQLSVDRQVILEAKIIEVQLNDSYQTGINWSIFNRGGNSRTSAGVISPDTFLQNSGALTTTSTGGLDSSGRPIVGGGLGSLPGQNLLSGVSNLGGLLGLAFQTSNFAALLSFLETQGTVHVLSSPRIATLNNQKAVLKVGTDEFFVTNVSTTTTTGTATTTSPTVTVQPFFSGVALDVTPQIDDKGNIILHIHPSVSNVTTVDKSLNLGGTNGTFTLPLASSSVSETDSIVRGRDGHIVAIGGLMRQATVTDRSGVPGASNLPVVGALLRNTNEVTQKRELVILLKPTIVSSDGAWTQNILDSQRNIQNLDPQSLAGQR